MGKELQGNAMHWAARCTGCHSPAIGVSAHLKGGNGSWISIVWSWREFSDVLVKTIDKRNNNQQKKITLMKESILK